MKHEEEASFRVTDKRLFRDDGEAKEETAGEDSQKESKSDDPLPILESDPSPGDSGARGSGEHIDFPSYILSYYTQSLVLMGEAPNPITNKTEEDLNAARHMVDILGMLQNKTKGNLTKEEQQLLDSVLYELRMKFMTKTNKIKL